MTTARSPARQVALNKIPEALRDLWRDCRAGDGDGNVSRALTMNFLGVARHDDEPGLRGALELLHRRQPCRALLVIADAGPQPDAAGVSVGTLSRGRTREIVLEQVELRVPWSWFGNVPGLVRPLLVNDIPTHLFWSTTLPPIPRHFDSLIELADHAVVDSGRFAIPAADLDALRARQDAGRRITDLTWLRIRPWRRALAEALERFGWQRGVPTAVTVRHCATNAAQAAAVLLGRWLEQRLAAAVFLEDTGPGDHNQPERVELRHGTSQVVATADDSGRIQVEVETHDSCWLPFHVPASRGAAGDLLAAAIDMA